MARIVFLCVPAYGHLNPVLPIMAELARRGHEVTAFNEPPFQSLIEANGAKFVAYPPAMSMEDMSAVLMNGDLMATFELFVRVTSPLYDFCVRMLKGDRPHVLVVDGISLWGELTGRRLGIPTVVTSPFFAYEIGRNAAPGEFRRNFGQFARLIGPLVWDWIKVGLKGPWWLPLH